MSWVYYADRKPTEADADRRGNVLVMCKDDSVGEVHITVPFNTSGILAWMNKKDLPPLPPRKIWRTPTQEDIDKAIEPIPCRYRDFDDQNWDEGFLNGICKFGECKFVVGEHACCYCEIEVDT